MGYTAKFSLSAAPGITANLYVAIYYATAPAVEVAHQLIAPPHTASVQVSIPNLNPVTLLIKVFETTGTVAGGTVRANFEIDPQSSGVNLRLPLFVHAGVDAGFPLRGNTYTDTSLIGWNFDFELGGVGTQEPGDHYTFDPVAGVVTLINPAGYQTQQGELWIFHFQPQVVSTTPSSNNTGSFSTLQTLSDDTTLDNTDAGSGFLLQGGRASFTITLPLISVVASYNPWPFFSQGGIHQNVTLKAAGTDQILAYSRPDTTKLVMGMGESMTLIPTPGGWLAQPSGPDGRDVGEIVSRYDTSNQNNVLFANGQTVQRSTYSRLWDYVQSIDPSMLISDANWNNTALNNQAKYSSGDGSTTFRVPRLWGVGVVRGANGATRKAGSWQDGQVGEFTLQAYKMQKGGADNHVYTLENIDDVAFPLVPRTYNTGLANIPDNQAVYFGIKC